MFQCPNCRAFTDLSADVDDTNEIDDTPANDETGDQASNSTGEPEADAPSTSATNSTAEPRDHLQELPEEAMLANNVENLHLEELDQEMEHAFRTASPALDPASTSLARSATISIPGWQPSLPLSVPAGRQPHLRSDTPTSDDNPLTPRNDSGPLAFDGRAGMP